MLTHLDSNGRANMVDVSDKAPTARRAVAEVPRRPNLEQVVARGPEALALANAVRARALPAVDAEELHLRAARRAGVQLQASSPKLEPEAAI